MDKKLEELVHWRAGEQCEYCHIPLPPFQIEHIVARKHGGLTAESNLALACVRCNLHKGPNLSGIDSADGHVVSLFHPRQQLWHEHFRWEGARLAGLTATGRASVAVLGINDPVRVELRQRLIDEGVFPTEPPL